MKVFCCWQPKSIFNRVNLEGRFIRSIFHKQIIIKVRRKSVVES